MANKPEFVHTFWALTRINEEGSVNYHQLNIVWWSDTAKRLELEQMPFPSEVRERLESASTALAHLTLPNGMLPQIGDGARASVREDIGQACLFVATGGASGRAPQRLVQHYSDGYYTSRSGWGEAKSLENESHVVLRHGGRMIGHAHEDRGSLHLYAEGTSWFIDSGFYSYQTGDRIRSYLNSRAAHNVASLTDLEYQSPEWVSIVAEKATAEYHFVEVEDPGYEGNAVHRRLIYLTQPDCWIVCDANSGNTSGNIRQSWHIDSGIVANRHDRGFVLRRGETRLLMNWLGELPQIDIRRAADGDLSGWIGTKWKTLDPGALITAEVPASSRGLVALFAPSGQAKQLGIVHSHVTSTGVMQVTLVRGNSTWTVIIDGGDIKVVER